MLDVPVKKPSYNLVCSLVHVAKEYLGLEVEEREVLFDEVKDFAEVR